MPSSKRRFFYRSAVFLLLFVLLAQALGFALVPYQSFTRLMMHDLYAQQGNVDIAFIGASHALYGFDTAVIDEQLGMNSFNLGSQSQKAMDSYYLLQELLRGGKPKIVVIELTYAMYTKFKGYDNLTGSMILFDYYHMSSNKLAYLADAFSFEDYGGLFLKCYRYRSNFANITDNLKRKLTVGYFSYDPAVSAFENEIYVNKGFVSHQGGFEEGGMGRVTPYKWDVGNLNPDELDYLNKMIRLCKDNDAQVVLVSTPLPLATLLTMGCYDDVHAYFADIACENGVPYFDFNLIREDCCARPDSGYFDTNHLNGNGAAAFSKALCGLLEKWRQGIDTADLFYADFKTLKAAYGGVSNVYLQTAAQGNMVTVTAKAYYGDAAVPEYRFMVRKAGENDYTILQEYSSSATVTMTAEKGQDLEIRVEARACGATQFAFDVIQVDN